MLQDQDDFKTRASNFLDTFQQTLQQETKLSSDSHQQKAMHSSNDKPLQKIIKYLRDQNKQLLDTIAKLMENKESVPIQRGNKCKNKPWKHCYECGDNQCHYSKNCNSHYKTDAHHNDATFKDTKGGSKHGLHLEHIKKHV